MPRMERKKILSDIARKLEDFQWALPFRDSVLDARRKTLHIGYHHSISFYRRSLESYDGLFAMKSNMLIEHNRYWGYPWQCLEKTPSDRKLDNGLDSDHLLSVCGGQCRTSKPVQGQVGLWAGPRADQVFLLPGPWGRAVLPWPGWQLHSPHPGHHLLLRQLLQQVGAWLSLFSWKTSGSHKRAVVSQIAFPNSDVMGILTLLLAYLLVQCTEELVVVVWPVSSRPEITVWSFLPKLLGLETWRDGSISCDFSFTCASFAKWKTSRKSIKILVCANQLGNLRHPKESKFLQFVLCRWRALHSLNIKKYLLWIKNQFQSKELSQERMFLKTLEEPLSRGTYSFTNWQSAGSHKDRICFPGLELERLSAAECAQIKR